MFKLNVENTTRLLGLGPWPVGVSGKDAVRHHNYGLTKVGEETDSVSFQYFPGLPGNGTMKEEERALFHGRLFSDAEGVKKYIDKLCKVRTELYADGDRNTLPMLFHNK